MSEEEWISVLKLSTLWGFSDLREKAIGELAWRTMDPVSRVELARKYRVKEWLIAGYRDLVKRSASISMEESERLGWRTAIQLYQLREECVPAQLLSTSMLGTSSWGGPGEDISRTLGTINRDHHNPTERIKVVFEGELKDVGE